MSEIEYDAKSEVTASEVTENGSTTPNRNLDDHNNGDVAATDGNEGKEHTRSRMALLFVLGFFAILFLVFVYAIMVGAKLSDLKDTLIGVIGSLSGILGFIVGYYYKSTLEQ